MNKFSFFLVLTVSAILVLIHACNNTTSTVTTHDKPAVSKKMTSVPAEVILFIKNQLPQVKLVQLSDYNPLWWSFYDRTVNPFYVAIDLDDNGQIDHALLCHSHNKVQLLVLLASGKTFRTWFAPDFSKITNGNHLEYGLSVQMPGQIDVVKPYTKSLILKNNGLLVSNYEMANRIYYYEKDTINLFTMQHER